MIRSPMLKGLFYRLYDDYMSSEPLIKDTRTTWKDLMRDLKRLFPDAEYVYVTDSKPYLIDPNDINKIVALNVAQKKGWLAEKFDCEDMSYNLLGNVRWGNGRHAFGIVRVERVDNGEHMLNCYIDMFNRFWYYEPQTNHFFKPKDMPNYKVKAVII